MLINLGRAELEQILADQGEIAVNCEFCNQLYRFEPADIAALFEQPGSAPKH
jgi:molecular chaperone Hsp33